MTTGAAKASQIIRPATDADFVMYYGRSVPWPWFGLCAEIEGVVAGIGGVAWTEAGAYAFLNCDQRYMPGALRAHKLARHVLDIAFKSGERTLYVMPTPGVSTAKRWLSALGFSFDHMRGSSEVWKSCRD